MEVCALVTETAQVKYASVIAQAKNSSFFMGRQTPWQFVCVVICSAISSTDNFATATFRGVSTREQPHRSMGVVTMDANIAIFNKECQCETPSVEDYCCLDNDVPSSCQLQPRKVSRAKAVAPLSNGVNNLEIAI